MWPSLLNFLAKDANREIRFVEVAGMTDYNKLQPEAFRALDINATDDVNYVDVEIQYLLNGVFNPEDLKSADDAPWMWIGVGQSSAAVDSAGSAFLSDYGDWGAEPMAFFDKNDTFKGTIPFGLANTGAFATNYVESFSNSGKNTGTDTTTFIRTGLIGFAFNHYDGTPSSATPQPVSGGFSNLTEGYWYPSKDPLTERWSRSGSIYSLVG